MSKSKNYEVGYKKPPKKSQFKKGQSGNKAGRPKGSLNVKTDLEEELSELVTITDKHGRKTQITKLRALLKNQVNRASTDPGAFKLIVNLLILLKKSELIDGEKAPLPWSDDDLLPGGSVNLPSDGDNSLDS